jgi:hypothetical protein
MPTNEEPKKESILAQPVAEELEITSEELKLEDVEKIVGGHGKIAISHPLP